MTSTSRNRTTQYEKPDSSTEFLPIFRHIFVTVGTTSFDGLVDTLLSQETMSLLRSWGTTHVRLQIGCSQSHEPREFRVEDIRFELFRYKVSLVGDMSWADLIISHAGAGSTLDALESGATLLVVPNDNLMDNHQIELANHLTRKRYAYSAPLLDFHTVCKGIRSDYLQKYLPRVPLDFHNFVLSIMTS